MSTVLLLVGDNVGVFVGAVGATVVGDAVGVDVDGDAVGAEGATVGRTVG